MKLFDYQQRFIDDFIKGKHTIMLYGPPRGGKTMFNLAMFDALMKQHQEDMYPGRVFIIDSLCAASLKDLDKEEEKYVFDGDPYMTMQEFQDRINLMAKNAIHFLQDMEDEFKRNGPAHVAQHGLRAKSIDDLFEGHVVTVRIKYLTGSSSTRKGMEVHVYDGGSSKTAGSGFDQTKLGSSGAETRAFIHDMLQDCCAKIMLFQKQTFTSQAAVPSRGYKSPTTRTQEIEASGTIRRFQRKSTGDIKEYGESDGKIYYRAAGSSFFSRSSKAGWPEVDKAMSVGWVEITNQLATGTPSPLSKWPPGVTITPKNPSAPLRSAWVAMHDEVDKLFDMVNRGTTPSMVRNASHYKGHKLELEVRVPAKIGDDSILEIRTTNCMSGCCQGKRIPDVRVAEVFQSGWIDSGKVIMKSNIDTVLGTIDKHHGVSAVGFHPGNIMGMGMDDDDDEADIQAQGRSNRSPAAAQWKVEGRCPTCGELGRMHMCAMICSKHGAYS